MPDRNRGSRFLTSDAPTDAALAIVLAYRRPHIEKFLIHTEHKTPDPTLSPRHRMNFCRRFWENMIE